MITIGIKELFVLAGIIAFMVWIRMFRTALETNTSTFFKKLSGPDSGGRGFGWRGILAAFVVGIICCCVFAVIVLRIWVFYHPVGAGRP